MISSSQVLVKATPLRAVLSFLGDRLDGAARERVFAKAGEEFPAEVERARKPIIASDQFPVIFVNRLIELAAAELREPAPRVAHAIGRRGAEEASNGLLRLAMILISVPNLLRKLSPVWSQLYTHGKMRSGSEERTAWIELSEYPVVSQTGCARITGWFEWFAQRAEKTATLSHSACRASGSPLCRWDLRW